MIVAAVCMYQDSHTVGKDAKVGEKAIKTRLVNILYEIPILNLTQILYLYRVPS